MKIQHDQMIMFYHGQEPNRLSQIKLIGDGVASYYCMCDLTQSSVANKSQDMSSASILTLKSNLTLDHNANYRCGQKITVSDLKIKTVNNPLLAIGQLLNDIDKRELLLEKSTIMCFYKVGFKN